MVNIYTALCKYISSEVQVYKQYTVDKFNSVNNLEINVLIVKRKWGGGGGGVCIWQERSTVKLLWLLLSNVKLLWLLLSNSWSFVTIVSTMFCNSHNIKKVKKIYWHYNKNPSIAIVCSDPKTCTVALILSSRCYIIFLFNYERWKCAAY